MPQTSFVRCGSRVCIATWPRLAVAVVVSLFLCYMTFPSPVYQELKQIMLERHAKLTREHLEKTGGGTSALRGRAHMSLVEAPSLKREIGEFCNERPQDSHPQLAFWKPLTRNTLGFRATAANCVLKEKTQTQHPFKMCTFSTDQDPHISKHIHEMGFWGANRVSIFEFALDRTRGAKWPSRNIVIDVGANMGFFSLMAATMGFEVYAFEPVRSALDLLVLSAEANNIAVTESVEPTGHRSMHLFPMAASNFHGAARTAVNEGNPGASYVVPESHGSTPVVRLDEMRKWIDPTHIQLLKISAEMYDAPVLEGARKLIHEGAIPFILFVLNDGHARARSCDPLATLMEFLNSGYSLFVSGVYYQNEDEVIDYLSSVPGRSVDLMFVAPGIRY